MTQSLVTVGIRSYNRPKTLQKVLHDTCNQTYNNLEIIIADNASPDPDVNALCMDAARKDSRVQYYRHSENKGGAYNVDFIQKIATGKYICLVADDDEYDERFIEECVGMLEFSGAGVVFTGMVNIDDDGNTIRRYPYLRRYGLVSDFLVADEINGKANLVCGVFRREAFDEMHVLYPLGPGVFNDVVFVLGVMARHHGFVIDKVLFRKRIQGDVKPFDPDDPNNQAFSLLEAPSYIYRCLMVTKDTPYFWMTLWIMTGRIPRACWITARRVWRKVCQTLKP